MELKRCPFCGGKAELRKEYSEHRDQYLVFVVCKECYASTNMYIPIKDDPVDLVIESWNKRVNNFKKIERKLEELENILYGHDYKLELIAEIKEML
jgi:Lar family restriction alleviation protein